MAYKSIFSQPSNTESIKSVKTGGYKPLFQQTSTSATPLASTSSLTNKDKLIAEYKNKPLAGNSLAEIIAKNPQGGQTTPPLMGGAKLGFEFKNIYQPITKEDQINARDISTKEKNILRGGTYKDTKNEIDHIIPVSLGGTKASYNLQSLFSKDLKPENRQEGKMLVEWDNIDKVEKGLITRGQAINNILQYQWANIDEKKSLENQSRLEIKKNPFDIMDSLSKLGDTATKVNAKVADTVFNVLSGTAGVATALITAPVIEGYNKLIGNKRTGKQQFEDFVKRATNTSQFAKQTIKGGIEAVPYIALETGKTLKAIGQGIVGKEDAVLDRMADVYIRHQQVGEAFGQTPATKDEIKQLLLSNSKEGNLAALVSTAGMYLDLLPIEQLLKGVVGKQVSKLPQTKIKEVQGVKNITADQLGDYISGRLAIGEPLTDIQQQALNNTTIRNIKDVYTQAKAGNLNVVSEQPTFANLANRPISQLFSESLNKFELNIPKEQIKSPQPIKALSEGQLKPEQIESFRKNASAQILDTTTKEVGESTGKMYQRFINEADLTGVKNASELQQRALQVVGKNAPKSVVDAINNWANSTEQIRFYGGVENGKDVTTPSSEVVIPAKTTEVAPKPSTKVSIPSQKIVNFKEISTGLRSDLELKANLQTDKIKKYEEEIKSGNPAPAIPVYEENGKYILNKDGFNRFTAQRNLGITDIKVEVQSKTDMSASSKQKEELIKQAEIVAKKMAIEFKPFNEIADTLVIENKIPQKEANRIATEAITAKPISPKMAQGEVKNQLPTETPGGIPIEYVEPKKAKVVKAIKSKKEEINIVENNKQTFAKLDDSANKEFKTTFAKLNKTQKDKILGETKLPIYGGIEAVNIVANPNKGIDFNLILNKEGLTGLLNDGILTDSYVLIKDKEIADELWNKFIKTKSKTPEQLKEYQGLPEKNKNDVPDISSIWPEEISKNIAKIQGIQVLDYSKFAVLSDGKINTPVDYNKLAFFNKLYPEATYRLSEDKYKPVQVVVGNKIKGLLMPMLDENLTSNFKGEKLKAPSGKGQADIGIFSEDTPVLEGSKIKPIQTPEMIQLVKELTGNLPKLNARLRTARGKFIGRGAGEIQLKPDIFKDPMQVAKTLAHEIGHLTDWLPKMGIKRTSLLQKLYILKNHLQTEFGTELVKNKDIKEELWALSIYWRPLGNASSGFLKYRKSASELYADAISALFNSPGLVEEKAPIFYKAFFSSLDKKPDINEKYWELQDLLFGAKEEVFKARENRIKQGFEKAYDIQKGFEAKKDKADKRLFERLRQQLDDRYYPVLKKVQEAEKNGVIIDDSENPKYLLSELSYINNENYLLVDSLDKEVSKPIKDAGMTDDDLGIYLLLDRIQGSRKEIANPYGFDVNTAPEQLNYLKERVGEENFKLLQEKVKLFHDIVFKSVEKAVEVGSYNKELFETTIKPSKENYATFSVVDYLQDYVPATIKKQVGTLKEVSNPYHATILKTLALNKLNAIQEAKNATIKLLQEQFPTEITKSKEIKTGKITIYPKTNYQLQVLEDGKLKSYEVDPYISKSFKTDSPDDLNAAVQLLGNVNQGFKSLVTTYNLGFSLAFNPIRDFRRNYKLIQDATIGGLIKAYFKSFPSAIRYAKGNLDDITRQMVEDKLINVPINDYNFDPRDDEMGRILDKYGVINKEDKLVGVSKARQLVLKPLTKLLESMRFVANTFEIVSKIAGTKIRVASGESGKKLAYNIRTYTGTPNWKVKGLHTKTTNELFIFSNIMKEGLKSDFIIATNPKTRSGYWWKTVKIDLMPKLLMFLASVGLFGAKLKSLFEGETEYDKTNYITIPVGERNGKTVYVRIPHDETGRLVSAIFWKALNYGAYRKSSDLQDIFSFGAGQVPQITPLVTFLSTWSQFLSGKNPYDKFRGRLLMDDTTFQAGGTPALKKMVQWSLNTMGLSQFTTYDPNKNDTVESIVQITPIINRLLKISDYGKTESSKELQNEIKTENARNLIKEKKIINDYINKYKSDYKAGIIDIENVGDEVVKEILGHYPETDEEDNRDKSIRRRLKTAMVVGVYDSRVDSLVYATSNKEKITLLKKYQTEMSGDKFYEFLTTLNDEKVISDDVFYDVLP